MSAHRFFWLWLIGSAASSMLGVVTHAVLGNARSPMIASALAVVIVGIQLCATYGVHALVQAQIAGAAYRYALATAGMLALGAFVLNFIALRDLVITWAGIDPTIAWIAPCIVDLGMTGSMIALLALATGQRADVLQGAQRPADTPPAVRVAVHNTVHNAIPDAHLVAAHRLVAQGVVRISPERIAQVLAEQSAGTAPSMIARRLQVGYSTVTKILEHQETLT